MCTTEKFVRQIALEEEAVGMGIDRYLGKIASNGSLTSKSDLLIRKHIAPLADILREEISRATSGRPGRDVSMFKFLSQFDPELLAFTTIKFSLAAVVKQQTLTKCANDVIERLEQTAALNELKVRSQSAYAALVKKLEVCPKPMHRHILMRRELESLAFASIKWDVNDRIRTGTYLISKMSGATALAGPVKVCKSRNETPYVMQATEQTKAWLDGKDAADALLFPVLSPMVVPPRQWTTPSDGGYLSPQLAQNLVRTRDRDMLKHINGSAMPKVYRAVNILQQTRWKINPGVLRVAKEILLANICAGNLRALSDSNEKTPRNSNFRKKSDAQTKVSRRLAMAQKVAVAERYVGEDEFYFVYSLDWRGRAYPVSSSISPQGDDLARGLITFASGVQLGANGAYWLAVHGANCFGFDKHSYQERVEWVDRHVEEIWDSAANPIEGNMFWTKAKNPYCFLAFCFEWLSLSITCISGSDRSQFVSYLPISFDGTCNGLQHFSALLLDEKGGAATNLTPSDTPSDIYDQVRARVADLIECDAESGLEIAKKWKGRVTREMVKRNTMTVPYSVSKYGMTNQMFDFLKADNGEVLNGYTDTRVQLQDARYLAQKNEIAIHETVLSARAAMMWLKEAASVMAAHKRPICWVAPSGFPVRQAYKSVKETRASFTVSGTRYQLVLRKEEGDIDRKKQITGISPNYVHSLDAAHMVSTVCLCADSGIRDFSMVHDSFGTHAGNAEILQKQLRRAFVEQYAGDVLGDFRSQLCAGAPAGTLFPPVPSFGQLDISSVADSMYFFN